MLQYLMVFDSISLPVLLTLSLTCSFKHLDASRKNSNFGSLAAMFQDLSLFGYRKNKKKK